MAKVQKQWDRIKSLTNELQQALMQVGSAVYSQTKASNGSNPGSN